MYMYVYIYTYIYICIYIYSIYTYVCMCVYVCICVFIYVYGYVYTCVRATVYYTNSLYLCYCGLFGGDASIFYSVVHCFEMLYRQLCTVTFV